MREVAFFNPLTANSSIWSDTLKQLGLPLNVVMSISKSMALCKNLSRIILNDPVKDFLFKCQIGFQGFVFRVIVRRGNGRLSETTVTLVRLVSKFDLKHLNCSVVLSFINSLPSLLISKVQPLRGEAKFQGYKVPYKWEELKFVYFWLLSCGRGITHSNYCSDVSLNQWNCC